MNTDTGDLRDFSTEDIKNLQEAIKDQSYVKIEKADMTQKQHLLKQVSLKDHKSKLGKKLTKFKGVQRNDIYPCGSGLKFKNCCRIQGKTSFD